MSADKRNLYLRNGIWWFKKQHNGKALRVSLETGNLGQAQERRDRLIDDLKAGKWGDRRLVGFNEAVTKFIDEHMPSLKPASRARYAVSIQNLLHNFDGVRMREISSAHLKAFEARRRRDGVTTSTIRRDLACLSSIFSLAEEEEWVETNPVKAFMRARKRRGLAEGAPRTRYLSQDEEALVLKLAPEKARDAITFAIDTGLRKEEQFSLLWSDVDLVGNWITVRREVAKSSKPRRVPLLPRARALLSEMTRTRRTVFVFATKADRRYSQSSPTMYEALQKACRRANISEHVEWHDLRRTCGCRLLNEHGFSMEQVSRWLGHSSVTVTERSYAFLDENRLQDRITPDDAINVLTPRFRTR